MAILFAVIFRQPDRARLARNPNCKNPGTLGPTPRTVYVMRGVPDHVVEQIRGGNIDLPQVQAIRRVLQQRGYNDQRVQIQLHRSPGGSRLVPKCFRSRIGPEPLMEMIV